MVTTPLALEVIVAVTGLPFCV
jgi:hypothetical protein